MRSLAKVFELTPWLLDHVGVLVWDNSPDCLHEFPSAFPFEYMHSDKNRGVSGAYNEAMNRAQTMHCDWLLLLDQDTIVPDGFLGSMIELSQALKGDVEIAAIVPTVWVDSVYVTPRRICFSRTRACDPSFSGVPEMECTAANTGALMRISSLLAIGGYSEDFSLEFSDMYVFHQLHRIGKKIWIAGDLRLDHQMTMFEYDGALTPERYLSFMEAEDAFVSNYKSGPENAIQSVRLLVRSWLQYVRYSNRAYATISLRFFLRRLRWSKATRNAAWKAHRATPK